MPPFFVLLCGSIIILTIIRVKNKQIKILKAQQLVFVIYEHSVNTQITKQTMITDTNQFSYDQYTMQEERTDGHGHS